MIAPVAPPSVANDWHAAALAFAQFAGEDCIQVRPVVCGQFGDCGKLCYGNNNPYSGLPARREQESATIKARMAELGVRALGEAAYPPDGEDACYTSAIIFDADVVGESGGDAYAALCRIVEEVCGSCNSEWP